MFWVLWQLLANFLSDRDSFEAAFRAYARALQCPGVDEDSVHYNHGAALMRSDRYSEALEVFGRVKGDSRSGPLGLLVVGGKMNALSLLARHD